MAGKVRFDIESDYSRHEVDPWDPVPFRILAEKKLQDVGWEKSHTNLVAGLLQRLYHCEAASRIEIDDFWWHFTHELDFDIEEQIKGN